MRLDELFRRGSSDRTPDAAATNRATLDAMKAEYERALSERTTARAELAGLKGKKDDPSVRRADELRGKIRDLEGSVRRTNDYELRKIENVFDKLKGSYETADQLRRAASRAATHGTDLTQAQMKQSAAGFAQQLKLQAGSQAINAIANVSTLGRMPVFGAAIHSGTATAMNAGLMGASFGTAAAMGGLAFGGALIAGGVNAAYSSYEEEQSLRRRLGQAGGLAEGDRAIQTLRRIGVTRGEIGALAEPLAHATGGFGGLQDVYKTQTAYGLGSNAIGLMGAAAATGAEGPQFKMVRDAISAGMVSGLKQGRFHEMVDGVTHLVRGATFGHTVTAGGMGGMLGLMGTLGGASGFKGGQLTGLMGAFDSAIRSQQGLSGSMSFITGYEYLNKPGGNLGPGFTPGFFPGGRVTPFDVYRLQEQGLTGPAGAALVRSRLEKYQQMSGVQPEDLATARYGTGPEAEAAKGRLTQFQDIGLKEDLGISYTAAAKLAEGYLSLKPGEALDDKTIEKAMKEGGDKQERAFEDIHDQTGLQQRIAYGIEALGRSMPGAQAGSFNKTFERLLEYGPGGGALAAAYATPSERLSSTSQLKDVLTASGVYTSVPLSAVGGGYSKIDQELTPAEAAELRKVFTSGDASRENFEKLLASMETSPAASDSVLAAVEATREWMKAPTAISDAEDAPVRSGVVGQSLGPEEATLASKIMMSLLEAAVVMTADPRFKQFSGTIPTMTRSDALQGFSHFFSTNPETPQKRSSRE